MADIAELERVMLAGIGEWFDLTTNGVWVDALKGVTEQFDRTGLRDALWSPAQTASICVVAILANETVKAPLFKTQTGDFCHSFRFSLAGPLHEFDYDQHQSAADLCVADGCSVLDPVLVVVALRFKQHVTKVWFLATRFQNTHSHFFFSGARLALFEESVKVLAYWMLSLDHGDFEDVHELMHEHWFGTTAVPQQSLEVRTHYLTASVNKSTIVSLQDAPACLLMSGIANLFVANDDGEGIAQAKRRKSNIEDRFNLYMKVLTALGCAVDGSPFKVKPTLKDLKRATSPAQELYVRLYLAFKNVDTGGSPMRVGMMVPGVRPDDKLGDPKAGLQIILDLLAEGLE